MTETKNNKRHESCIVFLNRPSFRGAVLTECSFVELKPKHRSVSLTSILDGNLQMLVVTGTIGQWMMLSTFGQIRQVQRSSVLLGCDTLSNTAKEENPTAKGSRPMSQFLLCQTQRQQMLFSAKGFKINTE